MAKIVTITNGTGTSDLINGTYTITADVTGYDNTSITPSSVNIEQGTNTYAFTIASSGTLTLHVTDNGMPIVGATFVRTDSFGNTYGTAITSDANGDAIFENVPYADTNAPTIYYKQTASDGDHEFDTAIQSTTLTTATSTVQVENPVGVTRTITLTDTNYANLSIESGTLTFTN